MYVYHQHIEIIISLLLLPGPSGLATLRASPPFCAATESQRACMARGPRGARARSRLADGLTPPGPPAGPFSPTPPRSFPPGLASFRGLPRSARPLNPIGRLWPGGQGACTLCAYGPPHPRPPQNAPPRTPAPSPRSGSASWPPPSLAPPRRSTSR